MKKKMMTITVIAVLTLLICIFWENDFLLGGNNSIDVIDVDKFGSSNEEERQENLIALLEQYAYEYVTENEDIESAQVKIEQNGGEYSVVVIMEADNELSQDYIVELKEYLKKMIPNLKGENIELQF